MEKQLTTKGQKNIVLTHIYAGVKVKKAPHEVTQHFQQKYNDWYFDLVKQNQDQFLLEIGGHDHITDVRVMND